LTSDVESLGDVAPFFFSDFHNEPCLSLAIGSQWVCWRLTVSNRGVFKGALSVSS
jgi:hypothetical protein